MARRPTGSTRKPMNATEAPYKTRGIGPSPREVTRVGPVPGFPKPTTPPTGPANMNKGLKKGRLR